MLQTRRAADRSQIVAAERSVRATRAPAELLQLAASLRTRIECWELTRAWLQDELDRLLVDLRAVSTWPRTARVRIWLYDAHRARRAIALDLATAARMIRESLRWLAELEAQLDLRPRPTPAGAPDDAARRVDLPACACAHHVDQP